MMEVIDGASKIYAYEPNKTTYENLIKNCSIDDKYKSKVIPFCAGVGGESRVAKMFIKNCSGQNSLFDNLPDTRETRGSIEVNIVGIKELISSNDIEKIDLLKVDIEGAEFEVFEAFDPEFLRDSVSKIVGEWHYLPGHDGEEIVSKLRDCGFEVKTVPVPYSGEIGGFCAWKPSKSAFVTTWMGDFPYWFDSFLKSCGGNKNYDWLIFADKEYSKDVPVNVKIIKHNIEDFNTLASNKLGFDVSIPSPYKLCDYKVLYGKIYEDYLSEYAYWGFCDLDVIWGDLDAFFGSYIDKKIDVITLGGEEVDGIHYRVAGPCTLVRNTDKNKMLYEDIPEINSLLGDKEYKNIDEREWSNLVKQREDISLEIVVGAQKHNDGKVWEEADWRGFKLYLPNGKEIAMYHMISKDKIVSSTGENSFHIGDENMPSRKVFVDGGAHMGESVRLFMDRFPDSNEYEIYSFEANDDLMDHLRSVVEPLGANVINKALWKEDGDIDFYKGFHLSSSVMKDKTWGQLDTENPVKVNSIDLAKWVVGNFSVKDYIILKLDIEGAEYDVLEHMFETGAIEYINELYIEFHSKKIPSILESRHEALISKLLGIKLIPRHWQAEEGELDSNILFITGGDENFMPLMEVCAESFSQFSNHKMIVYGYNCDVLFDFPNIIKKRIDLDLNEKEAKMDGRLLSVSFAKEKCCIDAIETSGYNKFVWVDGDAFVTKGVDKVINYLPMVDNYPIFNSHIYDSIVDNTIGRNIGDELAEEKLGIDVDKDRTINPWLHACLFVFNSDCKWFFEEVLDIAYGLNSEEREKYFRYASDEQVINLLMWKHKFTKRMKVHDYDTQSKEAAHGFFEGNLEECYEKYMTGNWLAPDVELPQKEEDIFMMHGQKDINVVKSLYSKYLEHIKNKKIAFITGGDEKYAPIVEQCVRSLREFSECDVIAYGFNSDLLFDIEGVKKRRVDVEDATLGGHKYMTFFFAKIQSNIDAIQNEGYDEYVWIDADTIATENIDKILDHTEGISDHPRCIKYRHSNITQWKCKPDGSHREERSYGDEICSYYGITPRVNGFLCATGIYAFNRESLGFFEEIMEVHGDTLNFDYPPSSNHRFIDDNAFSEERILNMLFWKYGYKDFLPITWFSLSDAEEGHVFDHSLYPYLYKGYSPMYLFDEREVHPMSLPMDASNVVAYHDNHNTYTHKSHEKPKAFLDMYIKDYQKRQSSLRIDKLMVVSHPDDEAIFGGSALMSEGGWKVVCTTCGGDKVRRAEFEKAMAYADVLEYEMWDFKSDLNSTYDEKELKSKLSRVLKEREYSKIVTHNDKGEYGHLQHKFLSRTMSELVKKNLYMFSDAGELSEDKLSDKIDLLRIYQSQTTDSSIGYPCLPGFKSYIRGENIIPYNRTISPEEMMSKTEDPSVSVHFFKNPTLELRGGDDSKDYRVEFIDGSNGKIVHQDTIKTNHWVNANRQWYTKWKLDVYDKSRLIVSHIFNAKDRRVLVCMDSKSLGDNLAWMPYVEEYRKKHQCRMVCSTFWNNLFEEQYPDIEFVMPGTKVRDIYAMYNIGWYFPHQEHMNPVDFREMPLQKAASDILGLEYEEIRPKILIPDSPRTVDGKYVCMAMNSTAQCKYWNCPDGWQQVVDYLIEKGYKVVNIGKETGDYMGNKPPSKIVNKTGDIPIEDRIVDLKYADMFIGIGSGLSWLSWAVGTPVVMISGFSKPYCEFSTGVQRIHNGTVCNGCFNDPNIEFDKGNWYWCPRGKDFECTREITPEMVKTGINMIIRDKYGEF